MQHQCVTSGGVAAACLEATHEDLLLSLVAHTAEIPHHNCTTRLPHQQCFSPCPATTATVQPYTTTATSSSHLLADCVASPDLQDSNFRVLQPTDQRCSQPHYQSVVSARQCSSASSTQSQRHPHHRSYFARHFNVPWLYCSSINPHHSVTMARLSLSSLLLLTILTITLLFTVQPTEARLREGECEVCLKVMNDIESSVKTKKLTTEQSIEKEIKTICKTYTTSEDRRLCYYIGGSADAATYLLGSISKPMKNHLPTSNICEKLKQMDPAICRLKYAQPEVEVDYSTVDLDKLRVKELKEVVRKLNTECIDCVEKGDYIRAIRAALPAKKEL